MKHNRIIALSLLLALLLAVPAYAAAGDGSDPLISRSYVDGTFRDELAKALDALGARAADRAAAAEALGPGWAVHTLAAGDSVTLRDGQQLVLLSGGVKLEIGAGKLINCTLGRGSSGGEARIGHRYVVWDGAQVEAACAQSAVVACSAGAAATVAPPKPTPQPGENPFTDVSEDDWFCADVVSAVRRGLVNGMTPTTYEPQGKLTLAQAVKLAACMRQLAADGAVTLQNGEPWYATYADYALQNGILAAMPEGGWDEPVTRVQFVGLFYRALPEDAYAPINDVPDGAIPDVAADAQGAREVYAFYAAGILTGYGADGVHEQGAFDPAGQISRAEVATIMNRMFDETARKRFAM